MLVSVLGFTNIGIEAKLHLSDRHRCMTFLNAQENLAATTNSQRLGLKFIKKQFQIEFFAQKMTCSLNVKSQVT